MIDPAQSGEEPFHGAVIVGIELSGFHAPLPVGSRRQPGSISAGDGEASTLGRRLASDLMADAGAATDDHDALLIE
jgi:hypothetical protein